MDVVEIIISVLITLAASSGFWAFVMKKMDKRNVETDMLIGLGHDRITFLGMSYIRRGYITYDEYENLHDYLYVPYEKLGGNGSAARIMEEVKKLPMYKGTYSH